MSEIRGDDATGIFYTKGDTYSIEKQPISSPEFITNILPKHINNLEHTHIALGHTRSPTQGDPKDNHNNHPLESENWIIIHNGGVTKMPRLVDYKYKGEVDSEILLSYIEKYGLKEGLPYVERGSAAVAVINKQDLNSVYLWREANPIIIACDTKSNTLFFASQKEFLERGLANKFLLFTSFQIRELPPNLLIKISINPFAVTSMGYIEVMKYNPAQYTTLSSWKKSKSDSKSKDMVFNPVTNRWELPHSKLENIEKCTFLLSGGTCFKGYTTPCPTKIQDCDYFTHPVSTSTATTSIIGDTGKSEVTKKYLKDRGFVDSEIDRMTQSAISTIMYCGYNGTDLTITKDGDIQLLHKSSPHVDVKHDINRYYIGGMSKDFGSWERLTKPNKGHMSIDGALIKRWDDLKKSHYIISTEDAIKEKLVDVAVLQADIDAYSASLMDPADMEE